MINDHEYIICFFTHDGADLYIKAETIDFEIHGTHTAMQTAISDAIVENTDNIIFEQYQTRIKA